MKDLFGQEIVDVERKVQSPYQKFKSFNHYRKSENKKERCKTCSSLIKKSYHSKNYYKCKLIGCSSSTATDIRLGNVCNKWKGSE